MYSLIYIAVFLMINQQLSMSVLIFNIQAIAINNIEKKIDFISSKVKRNLKVDF